ncbi:MAG TPA: hypothetical protein VGM64_00445 [Lacunisphaera sp.]|jgi:hypothetical protein
MKSPVLKIKCPLILAITLFLAGCMTHITTDITRNPPPTEKFSAFNHIDLLPVTLAAPYQGQDANKKALAKIQENITATMTPLLSKWNEPGSMPGPSRTLVITPVITEIKFINATARVWSGALSGSSAIIVKVRISEKETGHTIGEPIFYARAAAMGGAWTFGSTDNLMLSRIASRLTDYLADNYATAVGGPTGQDAKK